MSDAGHRMNEHANFLFRGLSDIVSKETPLNRYQWGDHCSAWNLVDEKNLSVKLEHMPPFTAEQKHFHQHAQQFFFILKGKAVIEIDDQRFTVKAHHGIHVLPMQKHKIINESDIDLEFILASQPSALNDRTDCE